MSTFDVTRIGPVDTGEFVVLGPCPGCWLWTVEYPREVATQYLPQEWNDEVERLLQEHLAECAGLREIVESRG